MIISEPRAVEYNGQPAQLSVLRNDGFCWGRIVLRCGNEMDVNPPDDLYCSDDIDVLDTLEDLIDNDPGCVGSAIGAPIGWGED